MMPRGLAAAVLETMPLTAVIKLPYFAEIVFRIIILIDLATTFGVFLIELNKKVSKVSNHVQG